MTNMVVPTVGRQVHYVPHGTPVRPDGTQAFDSHVCRSATITEVPSNPAPSAEGTVGLCVINPTGLFFRPLSDGGCEHDESYTLVDEGRVRVYTPGTWHWPERV